ncbi:unnamed protein product [Cladocopium goreaui]|uniref:Reverse transcriptase domain-containing protein n=1 Tax=Cladocopium goreaui TaxID=2562237 RepID=A0A9P1C378_9DINO|nr:unnamed protein product [Cladocopium goreaui]
MASAMASWTSLQVVLQAVPLEVPLTWVVPLVVPLLVPLVVWCPTWVVLVVLLDVFLTWVPLVVPVLVLLTWVVLVVLLEVYLTWVVPLVVPPAGAADMGGPPLVLALFAKVLQVVPLTLVWVLWEQLGLVFLLDLSVWKQLDPLVVLQVVPLDEVASGEVALFLKVPPTLVWVLWVLWEQRSRARGGPAAPIMAYWQGARGIAASTAAVFTAAEASAAESLANSRRICSRSRSPDGAFPALLRFGPMAALHVASRLDYICLRQMHADGESKNVQYLWDAPFLAQQEYGHAPMLCTVAKQWIPLHSHRRIQQVTMQQRQQSRQAYMTDSQEWRDFTQQTADQLKHVFQAAETTADDFLGQMHSRMMNTFHLHFPAGQNKRNPEHWRVALPTLLNKWEHRRQMLRPGLGTARNVFRVWFHATKFAVLKRFHRRQSHLTRKLQFQGIVNEAAAAAAKHDTHKLFQLINRFAPKQPRKQIQLRNQHGYMASPIEGAALMNKFVMDTWSGPSSMNLRFDEAPGVPFTVRQLERAIALIPTTKAVAKPFAPGVVWRQHSELHISDALINLLATWHEDACYFVQHEHTDSPIAVGKGVRQGCKAAPGLWNGFIVLMLHDLMAHTPFSWIQRCVTIYADDLHIGDSFVSLEDFYFFHRALGFLISTFASMDLHINTSKSAAIIELRGRQSLAVKRQLVQHDHTGDSLKIVLPNAETVYIPICKSTKYLGVVISYGNFEDDSLKHRLSLMHTGFRRLQKWLTGKHCLTSAQRYKLWLTCVYPILSYGIFALGLTHNGIQLATKHMMVMIRKLLQDHSYVTRRTNQQVLTDHHLRSPARLLHATAENLLRTLTERSMHVLHIGPSSCTVTLEPTGATISSIAPVTTPMAAARGLRMITADELHNLNQQAFGPRLLQIVHDRDWEKVEQEAEACAYLSTQCIICSHRVGRCQELHQHFRLQHPDLWEYAPQKAIQLTNLFSSESPCGCCGSYFRTHSCPIWSQIAVLLVNGAAVDTPDIEPVHDVRRRCEICLESFPTTTDLVQHLQVQHGLQGLSFNSSRDSLDGSSACAHCGQLFLTVSGLKSHIVQGRCIYFNPQASAETLKVDEMWQQACLEGKFLEILRSPQARLRLTVVCQACGKGCQRAADLSLHLQSAHSRLWRLSQRLTMILVSVFYRLQCFCNPSTGVKRGQLPFRQLAMAFHRLDTEPFAPTVITDQMFQEILAATLPRPMRYRLEQALVHRNFADTWKDPMILQLMRQQCILCGERLHTADLALHIREEMAAAEQMKEAFGALASLFRDPTLKLQENPRQAKARKRDDQNGRDTEMADLPPDVPQQQPALQMLTTMANLLIRHDQELQSLRKMDQYILFLNPDPTGALHLLMEATVQWRKKSKSLMMPLRQHLVLALLNKMRDRLAQLMKCNETDQLFTTSLAKGLILADRSFPFHRWDPQAQQLVLDKKSPVTGTKMDQHLEELTEMMQDPELVVRFHALRTPDSQLDRVIPWRMQINLRRDRAYELLHQISFNAIWMVVGATMKPHSLNQSPMATHLQTMLGQKGRGKGKHRPQKKQATPKSVPMKDLWGLHGETLISFLQRHADTPASLQAEVWFQDIVHNWGDALGQKDCAECAQRALAWLQSSAFDMRWERRLAVATDIQKFDSSNMHTPIILSIAPQYHSVGFCNLAALVTDWTQEQSMCTALLDAPACLCLHIDRMREDEAGAVTKSLCRIDIETAVTVPVFRTAGLTCASADYIPVAAVAHFGQDMAGHCKAILKMQPTLIDSSHPAAWLITEDDQRPQAVWKYPTWFAGNVITVWMLRTDCLRLPYYHATSTHGSDDSQHLPTPELNKADQAGGTMHEFLHLLQAQPGAHLRDKSETEGDP